MRHRYRLVHAAVLLAFAAPQAPAHGRTPVGDETPRPEKASLFVPRVLEDLSPDERETNTAFVQALVAQQQGTKLDALVRMFTDARFWMLPRSEVVKLGQEAIGPIRELVQDPGIRSSLRVEPLRALLMLDDADAYLYAERALRGETGWKPTEFEKLYIEALSRDLEEEQKLGHLLRLLRSPATSRTARKFLPPFGPRIAPPLNSILVDRQQSDELRLDALWVLRQLASPASADVIVAVASDETETDKLRYFAVSALVGFDAPSIVPALEWIANTWTATSEPVVYDVAREALDVLDERLLGVKPRAPALQRALEQGRVRE